MLTRLVPALVLLSACAPPVLTGTSDLKLRDILASPNVSSENIASLLAPEVEVHRAGGPVKGPTQAAAALAEIKPEGESKVLRHHDVSLVTLGDGRTVLVQRNAEDKITRAVALPAPGPGDEMPRKFVWWGAAWNTDPARARQDLCTATYAEGGRYVDPGHDVNGPVEVSQMIGNLRMVAPGSVIKFTEGVVDAGGGWRTESWVMLSKSGGRVLFRGVDVIHLDDDGKIELLAGFIGERR